VTDQPIDDDLSGMDPDRMRVLAGVSGDFAQARRMMAALAAGQVDAMAMLCGEVAASDPMMAFIAAVTEGVQLARALWGDQAEAILADRAMKQIDLATQNRRRFGDGES
jgi:ABC-type nitrate/sulfonate/bicarbonate transport system substrate-binding protein